MRMTSKPHEIRMVWSPSFLEVTKTASIILADTKYGDEKPVMEDVSKLGSYENYSQSIAATDSREASKCSRVGDFLRPSDYVFMCESPRSRLCFEPAPPLYYA